jgi:hypothetical protein
MITQHQKSVNVDRVKLLEIMKTNLAIHQQDYKEAVLGYKVKLLVDLQTAIMTVNEKTPDQLKGLTLVRFDFPSNHAKDYQEMIDMLEMSVDEHIELDSNSFQSYVKNRFVWSDSFNTSNSLYKQFAASAKLI